MGAAGAKAARYQRGSTRNEKGHARQAGPKRGRKVGQTKAHARRDDQQRRRRRR